MRESRFAVAVLGTVFYCRYWISGLVQYRLYHLDIPDRHSDYFVYSHCLSERQSIAIGIDQGASRKAFGGKQREVLAQ